MLINNSQFISFTCLPFILNCINYTLTELDGWVFYIERISNQQILSNLYILFYLII